ncbi:MAG: methionine--tRNA ligase [Promethearchaeota archaeon]
MKKRKILVTCALPYANSELHIAHARSTYIPGDIYVRYCRLKGHEVVFVSGTDEHGTPISLRAEEEGITPLEVATKYYEQDVNDFKRLGISFDNFSRTSRKLHHETTQEVFLKLYERGHIYEKELLLPYCPNDKRFLPDRYVEGICPYCGFENARGDECDKCGRALMEGELRFPRCKICGTPTINKSSTHWYLKLSDFADKLRKWIETEDVLPVYGKDYLIGQYLEPGLEDICITRDLDWGVPVPLDNAEGKVVYVWFDAFLGYKTSTKEWAIEIAKDESKWKEFWLKDLAEEKDTELIHFIGKGIVYHHALFWPTELMGSGHRVPTKIPTYGYGNLEGRKMSKGRGWYVGLTEFLDNFDPDTLRYYWVGYSNLLEDADFKWKEYQAKVNNELVSDLGNFIHRTLTFTNRFFDGIVQEISVPDEADNMLLEHLGELQKSIEQSIESFELRTGLLSIMGFMHECNKYFNDKAPWKMIKEAPEKAKITLNVCAKVVRALALFMEPYLPFAAERVWKALGFEDSVHEQNWDAALEGIPAGHKIAEDPEPLFVKIEDKTIKAQEEKLQATLVEPTEPTTLITFDDFKALDMRVGKVTVAEHVEGTEKLIRMEVDLGAELGTRQIVSSLIGYYKPEELVDKQIIVLVNLKPAELRGLTSNGMLLAAEDPQTEALGLLMVDKPLRPGSKIT